jgi:hypothetical protein
LRLFVGQLRPYLAQDVARNGKESRCAVSLYAHLLVLTVRSATATYYV